MSRLPRWVHRAIAFLGGYFWLPCPLCRRPFGGHEWRDIDGRISMIPVSRHWQPGLQTGTSLGICPDCTRAGYGRSQEWVTRP